jgi:macrolide-specific efflux system membrane fusion protein
MKTHHFSALAALTVVVSAYVVPAGAQAPAAGRKIQIDGGLVTLINDVMVPAQEAGRLMKVNVKGGEAVDENFVIAEIDNRDTLAKEKIAKGELDVANAQAASEAELRLAKEGVNVSKAEYDTTLEIRERNSGAVSDTEVRKYKFQWDRAIAQVDVAQVDRVVAGLTAKVKEAQLEATRNELERRKITAPFKGEVDDVKRQVGEWVQPGEPIARIVQLDRLRVKAMVYATDVAPSDVLFKPVVITIRTAGGRSESVKGQIDFASSIIEVTGEFRVWCDIDNKKVIDPVTKKESWRIQPGSVASVEIDLNPPVARSPLKAEPAKGGPSLTGASPGTFRPRSGLEASGVKVEARKPVVPDAATKDRETKTGEKKVDVNKPESRLDETKGKTKER